MNLSEEACPMGGPDAHAYRAAANTGLPLADFECKHGRLPHENCLECPPWKHEIPAKVDGDPWKVVPSRVTMPGLSVAE